MQNLTAQEIIKRFHLEPHLEGGYFREDYKSEIVLPGSVTGKGDRSIITTCYYLIPKGERSIFHRLFSDEIWYFLFGGAVNFFEIDDSGKMTTTVLGPDLRKNQVLKHLVKKGAWFGVLPRDGTDYAFFSAIVYPGFEYADWEKGDRDFLQKICPEAVETIKLLT